MKRHVIDTHALLYYLRNSLPTKAGRIFEGAERGINEIFIPAIVLAEALYVFEETNSIDKFWEALALIETSPSFKVYPLDLEIVKLLPEIELHELHDRIIITTAKILEAEAIVTKDLAIQKAFKTIWA